VKRRGESSREGRMRDKYRGRKKRRKREKEEKR
jgi:hypothetical protein